MDNLDDVPVHKSGKLDRSYELYIVQAVFVALATVCVVLRVYIKCFIVKANLLDDYLIYSALVCCPVGYIVYSGVVIDGALNGAMGKHPSLGFTTDEAARGLRTWYITMVLYPWIVIAIRAAVCVLLYRINTKRSYAWCIRAIFAASTLISIAFFFILLLQCNPPRHFWTVLYGERGTCYDRSIVDYSTTVYSILSAIFDWSLGLLPIAILWSVQINRRTKIAIASLLSLGVIAGIVLIVRITYVTRLQPGLRFLYESLDVAIWSVMEPALGIIASCAATFRPLFKNFGLGWNSRKQHTNGYQLREHNPQDAFKPAMNFREASHGSHLDVIADGSERGGSERALV